MFILQDSKDVDMLMSKNSKLWKEYNLAYQEWLKMRDNFWHKMRRKVSSKANLSFSEKEKQMINSQELFNSYAMVYDELIDLDQSYYGQKYKTKTIYDEKTYQQCQKIYKKANIIIEKISKEHNNCLEDNLKYTKFLSLAKLYFRKVSFFTVVNNYDVVITNDDIDYLEREDFDLRNIINRAFKEDWDYQYFMKMVSIYQKYEDEIEEAFTYLKKQGYTEIINEFSSNESLKNNPLDIILHNPEILKDKIFDRKTLLEVKKKLYELINNSKDNVKNEQNIEIIKKINLALK